ncbi:MAG: RraA family protein [Glaciecola sp.]|jgi:regulator of RNase E activity RraA
MTHPSYAKFTEISTCDLADALPRSQFMSHHIHPLWPEMPRFAGRAYTVYCAPGDHLMVHKAIYEAQPGDVLVIQGDHQYAVSGGNVCAIAQKNGITAFVVDGVIRDIDEVRELAFPIHAIGVCPKPGAKKVLSPERPTVSVGGVMVAHGDVILADNDGVAVIPQAQADSALAIAQKRHAKDAGQTLEEWEANHFASVQQIITDLSGK